MLKKILKSPLIYLVFGVVVLFFLIISKNLFAQLNYLRLNSASSIATVGNIQDAYGQAYKVVNMSNNAYFVPNKTYPEFGSFLSNSPRYTFHSRCGDNICNILTENNDPNDPNYCESDCVNIVGSYKFCGDGVCSAKNSCDGYSSFGKFINCEALPDVGENYFNCPQDCVEPFQNRDCGVCGTYYDLANGRYRICPNQCNENEASLINCVKSEIHNLVDYSYNNSIFGIYSMFNTYVVQENYLPNPGFFSCDPSLANACPAGSYCPTNGTTNSTIVSCPAGYFCPKGSMKPQICPPRTYSTGGAATCTNCPSYKFSAPGAIAASGLGGCYDLSVCGDNVCNNLPPYNENPRNCPTDCFVIGDGLCTALENNNPGSPNYSPKDCYCGDGVCANGETSVSCFVDCHCGNGVCDFRQGLGDETEENCSLDCNFSTCGNGIREPYEIYSTCSQDTGCGDGFCELSREDSYNCSVDCGPPSVCGNGTCESGESYYNCLSDCNKCGNGICDTVTGMPIMTEDGFVVLSLEAENSSPSSCPIDCKCGDGICDAYESDTESCAADCGCGNGTCTAGETTANCSYDCGFCGDNICGYHNKKIETAYSNPDLNYYYYCPGDCASGDIRTPMPIEAVQ